MRYTISHIQTTRNIHVLRKSHDALSIDTQSKRAGHTRRLGVSPPQNDVAMIAIVIIWGQEWHVGDILCHNCIFEHSGSFTQPHLETSIISKSKNRYAKGR